MTTTVLPQIDSFTKSDHRREASDCEIYDDVQFSTSPISSDSDHANQQQYTDDLSIKYESNQEHDSVITYGSDELVDNYENVSFRHMLTDNQHHHHEVATYHPNWSAYMSAGAAIDNETALAYSVPYQVPTSYQTMELGQVVPNYNFELESTTPVEVPQYYSPDCAYQTEATAHRVSVIVGNTEHPDLQFQPEFQSPYYNPCVYSVPPTTYKRKEKRKEKKKSPKSVIYFEKSELTPDHKNGIHLWQFLLSLLRQPKFEKHIKWIDQTRGIFKIEDSQEVARLWGLRKNRPNMNYDKLSRSIRQYYKKNIIKKPKETSRLVYQFCEKIMAAADPIKCSVKSLLCE